MSCLLFFLILHISACLDLQEKNSYLLLMRSLEVATKRNLYQWASNDVDGDNQYKGFPGYIANGCDVHDLPHDFRYLVFIIAFLCRYHLNLF